MLLGVHSMKIGYGPLLYGNVNKKLIPDCFLIFFLILRWLPFISQGIIHSEIELYPQGNIYCYFMEVRKIISNPFPLEKIWADFTF